MHSLVDTVKENATHTQCGRVRLPVQREGEAGPVTAIPLAKNVASTAGHLQARVSITQSVVPNNSSALPLAVKCQLTVSRILRVSVPTNSGRTSLSEQTMCHHTN